MLYSDYFEGFREWRVLGELAEYGAVEEKGHRYPLLRLTVPGERALVITSGFHGEEQAGPLTLLEHLPDIVAHAQARGVGLRVYPCINPSGFEDHTRYNASGEKPNNDFLRYLQPDGSWKGELVPGEPDLPYKLFDGGPKETRALRADLERHPAPYAALDIHQDRYISGTWTYAYTFGERAGFRPMLEASREYAKIAAGFLVDETHRLCTDGDGLIEFRDGSVTDYFYRRGARWAAALETTVQVPLDRCHAINLIWMKGFIDLVAGERVPERSSA